MTRAGLTRLVPMVAVGCLVMSCSATVTSGEAADPPGRTTTAGTDTPATENPTAPLPSGQPPGRLTISVLPWRLPVPVAREAAMATPTGVVVAGGLVAGDQSTATAYRLDLETGRAVALPDLPVPVHDVGGAIVDGRPQVIGGGNATEQAVVQTLSGRRGWRMSTLASPRSDLGAVTTGDRVFVVGGYDGVTPALPDILVSTSGGPFHIFGQLRVPVRYAATAVSGGAIWVFGGERDGAEVNVIQRIDLETGQTSVAARLRQALGHASVVAFGNRLLLVGGRTTVSTSSISAAMWWFDPSDPSALRRAGTLPVRLADSAAVTTHGATYLVGGEGPRLSDRVLRITYGPQP